MSYLKSRGIDTDFAKEYSVYERENDIIFECLQGR